MEETDKIIKFNNDNLEIDVKISPFEKTIWLSIDQISLLLYISAILLNFFITIPQ